MLVRLQDILSHAQRHKYAVGAFNVSDLEMVQAVVAAAAKLRSPAIINTSSKAIDYAGLEEIATVVKIMARKVKVPIVLNLDHGRDPKLARACLRAGYTGLMFDGSRFPEAQNIKLTRQVVTFAKQKKIGVEGELGIVKFDEDSAQVKRDLRSSKTDPQAAANFVRQTGIIAFAVAIGNSHGLPVPGEKLDFELLKKIRHFVKVPLVLHGASGTAATDIRRAISLGVCKINIDTDLRLAFTRAIRGFLQNNRRVFDPRAELSPARAEIMSVVMEKMKIFGSIKRY